MKVYLIENRGVELAADTQEELELLSRIHDQIHEGRLLHYGVSPASYHFLVDGEQPRGNRSVSFPRKPLDTT